MNNRNNREWKNQYIVDLTPDPEEVRNKPTGHHYPRMVICVRLPWKRAPYTVGKEYMAAGLVYFDGDTSELFYLIERDDIGSKRLTAPVEAFIDKDGDNSLFALDNVFNYVFTGPGWRDDE